MQGGNAPAADVFSTFPINTLWEFLTQLASSPTASAKMSNRQRG